MSSPEPGFHGIDHMKQESVTSSCQAWGPFLSLGCVSEEADILLQSKTQELVSGGRTSPSCPPTAPARLTRSLLGPNPIDPHPHSYLLALSSLGCSFLLIICSNCFHHGSALLHLSNLALTEAFWDEVFFLDVEVCVNFSNFHTDSYLLSALWAFRTFS